MREDEEESWQLDLPGYELSHCLETNRKLSEGEILLNIPATTFVFNALERIFTFVLVDLEQMVLQGKDMSFSLVRKFVVDFYMCELADFLLYTAMSAP